MSWASRRGAALGSRASQDRWGSFETSRNAGTWRSRRGGRAWRARTAAVLVNQKRGRRRACRRPCAAAGRGRRSVCDFLEQAHESPRARPVDAGALADARLARGLGAAPRRPPSARRERAAPRKERASKFLPAAVAEQDLDDAPRAFVLPELGGPQVLSGLRPPSEPLRELQSQEPLRDLARHDKTPPAAPAPREADAVPPPPACISKQTRVPSQDLEPGSPAAQRQPHLAARDFVKSGRQPRALRAFLRLYYPLRRAARRRTSSSVMIERVVPGPGAARGQRSAARHFSHPLSTPVRDSARRQIAPTRARRRHTSRVVAQTWPSAIALFSASRAASTASRRRSQGSTVLQPVARPWPPSVPDVVAWTKRGPRAAPKAGAVGWRRRSFRRRKPSISCRVGQRSTQGSSSWCWTIQDACAAPVRASESQRRCTSVHGTGAPPIWCSGRWRRLWPSSWLKASVLQPVSTCFFASEPTTASRRTTPRRDRGDTSRQREQQTRLAVSR